MQTKTVSYYLKKSILSLIAVFIMAVGIEMFLLGGLGVDSVSVFIQGIQFVIRDYLDPNVTYGTASLIFNVSLLVIAVLVSRKNVSVGTIITAFFLGSICNIIEPTMLSWMPAQPSMIFKLVLVIAGQLVLCIGTALQVSIRFGQAAPNAILFKISDSTGIYFKYARIIYEAICVIAGVLLGGIVGIGTVLCVITTGPIVSFLARVYNRTFLKAIGLDDPLNEMKPQKEKEVEEVTPEEALVK